MFPPLKWFVFKGVKTSLFPPLNVFCCTKPYPTDGVLPGTWGGSSPGQGAAYNRHKRSLLGTECKDFCFRQCLLGRFHESCLVRLFWIPRHLWQSQLPIPIEVKHLELWWRRDTKHVEERKHSLKSLRLWAITWLAGCFKSFRKWAVSLCRRKTKCPISAGVDHQSLR